jgi:hypothetical protein
MSKFKCNMCKISPSTFSIINNTKLKEQIECKDCKIKSFDSIMSTGRYYTCQVEQEMYDRLGVYGNRFVSSIDPKLRSNTLNIDIIKTNIK